MEKPWYFLGFQVCEKETTYNKQTHIVVSLEEKTV